MKSKPPFVPPDPLNGLPHIDPPEPYDRESLKSSPLYEKYLRKYDPKAPESKKKAKEERSRMRKLWWAQNWIAFFSLIVAVIALVVALLK